MENLIFSAERNLAKKDIAEFYNDQWIKDARNIVMTGKASTGKTFLAESLIYQACKMGYNAKKYKTKMLFEELRFNKSTGTLLKFFKNILRFKVIILDDFLTAAISEHESGDLLEVIDQRMENSCIFVTTQYPVSKWHNRIPDPTIADAICDRLVQGSFMFQLEGDAIRKLIKDKKK